MRTLYDSNGVPHTVESDEDAEAMIADCGYTEQPVINRVAAGHSLPDHKPDGVDDEVQSVTEQEEQ